MLEGRGVVQRCLAHVLAVIIVLSGFQSGSLSAQSTDSVGGLDTEAPFIDIEQVQTGNLGEIQVFSATVTDNFKTEKVSLFYRFSQDAEYTETEMKSVAGSSFYSAAVDTANVSAQSIEYYLSAGDAAGNSVFRGYIFDPLVRVLSVPPAELTATDSEIAAQPVTEPPPEVSKKSNKLYYILGAVALVALAGLAASSGGGSSGSSGSSGSGCDPAGCQVSLVVAPP